MKPESPAVQLLSPADADFVKGLKDALHDEIVHGRHYGGLLATVSRLVDRLQKEAMDAADLEDAPLWGTIVCVRDGLGLRIDGPEPDDKFQVIASSAEEASDILGYVSALNAACKKLQEIRDRCLEISRKRQQLEAEQAALRQPAEVTVDDHIRLLRQYSKTKDIGQQLIGLIAESRGVPLGTLYRDGCYGVGPED